MAGDLIFPRVEVFWGDLNLTSQTLPRAQQAAPIVFNVQAQLHDGNSNPTGSMEWEPTGPAFAIYEQCLKDRLQEQIVVKFYYLNGRSISLYFVWAGQSITYGETMKISVDLKSELDGMVNGVPRSTSSANKNEKPMSLVDQLTTLTKQYNMDPKLLLYSKIAKKDMETATIKSMNQPNTTYAQAVNSLVQSNGNILFPNNIGGVHMTALTPWSYSGESKTVVEAPTNKDPDTTIRYGYLLGPSMYVSIDRKYQWTPPQQTNTNQIGGNAKPTVKGKRKKSTSTKTTNSDGSVTTVTVRQNRNGTVTKTETNRKKVGNKVETTTTQTTEPANTRNALSAATGGSAAPGVSQGRLKKGILNADDKVGVAKQKLLNDENAAKLSVTTMMVPALTGIKPGDILYVPSLSTATDLFMEDWVVRGVTYSQTDGGVNLSIEATRWFGNPALMQPTPAKPWIEKARDFNSDPTLGKWQQYAWALEPQTPAPAPVVASPALPVPATPAQQAQAEFSTTRTAAIG